MSRPYLSPALGCGKETIKVLKKQGRMQGGGARVNALDDIRV